MLILINFLISHLSVVREKMTILIFKFFITEKVLKRPFQTLKELSVCIHTGLAIFHEQLNEQEYEHI